MRSWRAIAVAALVAWTAGCLRAQPEKSDASSGSGGAPDGGAGAGGGPPDGGAGAGGGGAKPGSILWARSASSVYLLGVGESSTGVVVTGYINAPADLGGSLLAPAGAADTVIAQFASSDGSHIYSHRFGGGSPAGTSYVYGRLGTLDATGLPLIQGVSFCDPSTIPACTAVDVGVGPTNPGGGPGGDGFLGRYSITTGAPLWSKRLVGPGDDQFVAVCNGPAGSVFAAGRFDQTTVLAGADTTNIAAGGDRDIVITRINGTTGAIEALKTFAGPGFEQPSALAWTGSELIAAGFFSGTTVFGSQTLSSAYFDVWVAKLTSDGDPLWVVRLGGGGPDKYPYVALDRSGDIYVTGFVSGSAMIGAFPVGDAGGTDIFIAKLRNADGGVIWAKSVGSSGDDTAAAIAVTQAGQILVAGTIAGPINPGGPFHGGTDALLISYNGAGERLWTKVIGTTGADGTFAISTGSGSFFAALNLGADIGSSIEGVPIVGAPRPTGLVIKILP